MVARANMGADGLRISKPGYDVLTTGVENYLFFSGSDFMRVRLVGTIVMNSGDNLVAIPIGVKTSAVVNANVGGTYYDATQAGFDYEADNNYMYIKRRAGTTGAISLSYAVRSETF